MKYKIVFNEKVVGEEPEEMSIARIEKYERTNGLSLLRIDVIIQEDTVYYVFFKPDRFSHTKRQWETMQ